MTLHAVIADLTPEQREVFYAFIDRVDPRGHAEVERRVALRETWVDTEAPAGVSRAPRLALVR